jgi:hypothetical protein
MNPSAALPSPAAPPVCTPSKIRVPAPSIQRPIKILLPNSSGPQLRLYVLPGPVE